MGLISIMPNGPYIHHAKWDFIQYAKWDISSCQIGFISIMLNGTYDHHAKLAL